MLQDPYLIKHLKGFLHEPEQCRIARVSKVFARNNIKRRPGFGRCSVCGDWADCGKEWKTTDHVGHWMSQEMSHGKFKSTVTGRLFCEACALYPHFPEYHQWQVIFPREYIDIPSPGADGHFRYYFPHTLPWRRGRYYGRQLALYHDPDTRMLKVHLSTARDVVQDFWMCMFIMLLTFIFGVGMTMLFNYNKRRIV